MHHGEGDIIRGETHCDTIGDFFKNPYVIRILRKWYRIKYEEELEKGEKLPIWLEKKDRDKGFTPEFYNFIHSIFKDAADMEEFLSFVKAEYIDNTDVRDDILCEYENEDIIRLLLCFDEIRDQLWYDGRGQSFRQSVAGIFSTKVIDILRDAHDNYPIENGDLSNYAAMEQMLTHGYSPISSEGEILCYVDTGDEGEVQVVTLKDSSEQIFPVTPDGIAIGDPEISEQDDLVLYTRKDVVTRIKEVEKIFRHYMEEGDDSELSEKEMKIKQSLLDAHAHQKGLILKSFEDIVSDFVRELESFLQKLPVEDISRIDELKQKGEIGNKGQAIFGVVEEDGVTPSEEKVVTGKPSLSRTSLKVVSSN